MDIVHSDKLYNGRRNEESNQTRCVRVEKGKEEET